MNVRRIGRSPNPAERGLQVLLEHPEVLDRGARNVFGAAEGLFGTQLERRWRSLSEHQRDRWRDEAIRLTHDHIASYVQPEMPEHPDPGASAPAPADAPQQLRVRIA